MSERRRPLSDPEVLELFEDEPELLAIVDAIHATQVPRRARVSRPLLVAASAVAALVVVAPIPWEFRGADLTERALAAIGDARVVHLVASRPEQGQVIVDLETGSETPTALELESWFDTETRELRTVTRRQGIVVADTTTRKAAGEGAPDPVVATFVRGYRSALATGEVEVIRRGLFDGAEVVWVRASLPGARRDEVALDPETNLPRAFRLVVASEPEGPLWRVSEIDSRVRRDRDLDSKPAREGPVAGRVESERTVMLAEAARLLEGRALSAGRQLGGLRLNAVVAQGLSRASADGTRQAGTGLELRYGDSGGDFVEILQAVTPEPAYAFIEGWLTFGFAPIPEGAVTVIELERSGDEFWLGQLRAGEVFLTIRASQRQLVVAAAQSLVPLR